MRRRTYREFTSEAELVGATRDWLLADGWSCYFEVAPWGAGAQRADIVATRGPLLAVVECKLSFGLALLEQCESWLKYAHVVWAAAPYGRRNALATRVASWLGVGVVDVGLGYDEGQLKAEVRANPALRRKVNHEKLRRFLDVDTAQHQPGNNHSFTTPRTKTLKALREVVAAAGGRIPVKEAITRITHHYSTAASARQTIVRDAEWGHISGIRIAREGKAVFFEVAP